MAVTVVRTISEEALATDLSTISASVGNVSGSIQALQSTVATLDLVPAGIIMPYAGATAPDSKWAICDGAAISRTTYSSLFSIIGTTYGTGNGSTTFNIPNLKGRTIVGVDSAQTEFDSRGKTGGAKTHTLSTGEMPSHSHTQSAHSHHLGGHTWAWGPDGNVYTPTNAYGGQSSNNWLYTWQGSWNYSDSQTPAIQSTGGGGAHNNLQPYISINYIIKVA